MVEELSEIEMFKEQKDGKGSISVISIIYIQLARTYVYF